MIKSPQFYLMGLLLILVSGCQQTSPVGEPKSWFWFEKESNTPPSTNRQCFSKSSTPEQRTQSTVFMLAAGANTGKLTKTSSDLENFSQAMQGYFKIPQSQICQLPNVFKAELETALQSLNALMASHDLVIIYFSGHGTFIEDNNGDEADRWDEILVTYDSQCKKKVKDDKVKDDDGLRDDYFVKLVNHLPTDRVLTVMDTCFSSGMVLGSSLPNPLLANARSKILVKGECGTQAPSLQSDKKNLIKNEVGNLDSLKGLLLAAADEKQNAFEIEKGGLFTVEFVEQLRQYADLKKAFEQTVQQVQEITRESKSPQTPQAIGKWEILEENSN
jgi:hypothetical protein